MPLFTPPRKKPCPRCQAEIEASVEKSFALFAEVSDTVSCPKCKAKLRWRSQPFFYQDLAVVLFGSSLLLIEVPIVAIVFLFSALFCFFFGESQMALQEPSE